MKYLFLVLIISCSSSSGTLEPDGGILNMDSGTSVCDPNIYLGNNWTEVCINGTCQCSCNTKACNVGLNSFACGINCK